MELEQIKIFLRVAAKGSLSGAAGELYVSHSTVSRAIARLESDLGVSLFDRCGRGVILTPAGRALYEGGAELTQTADRLEQLVRKLGVEKCEKEKSSG